MSAGLTRVRLAPVAAFRAVPETGRSTVGFPLLSASSRFVRQKERRAFVSRRQGANVALMEQAIRRLGGTLCIIDHIHFLCRNTQNEITTQADAMQKLKNLAVKYGCKIIVVSQPRKAQSNAKGKVLHVTDIKGSETLTSDADAIFAIHRDIIKNKDESTKDDYSPVTEIHLLGARSKGDGSTFAKLYFAGDICTFNEMEYQHSESNPASQPEESIF